MGGKQHNEAGGLIFDTSKSYIISSSKSTHLKSVQFQLCRYVIIVMSSIKKYQIHSALCVMCIL